MSSNKVRDAFLGLAVGDALGVPHEFWPRYELEKNPVTTMVGGGTWNQEEGTWSDDASLSFCLAEMLIEGYDLHSLATKFVAWLDSGYWSARGTAFDVGRSTAGAIARLRGQIGHPAEAGLRREQDNGNGSLMRILPAVFYVHGKAPEERAWIAAELSALTHGHRRAQLACILYLEIALEILDGASLYEAYKRASEEMANRFADEKELHHFQRIISLDLPHLPKKDILSSAYVIESLEAALWCTLTTSSYEEAVLRAVNLGGDTDSIASITGGLTGLYYGAEEIPGKWLSVLARRRDIEILADRLNEKLMISQRLPASVD